MCTIVIEALTPFNRTSRIKMYKSIARSRLFCRIAKRSIYHPSEHVLGSLEITRGYFACLFSFIEARMLNIVIEYQISFRTANFELHSVFVWTRIFFYTDEKKMHFQRDPDTGRRALSLFDIPSKIYVDKLK